MPSLKGRLTSELSSIFKGMVAFGQKKGQLKKQALLEHKPFFAYYKAKLFSHSTFENYYSEAKQFIHWCADEYGLRSIYRLKPEMLSAYVSQAGQGLSANTLKTRIAAIIKLAEGLDSVTGKQKGESFRAIARELYQNLVSTTPQRPVYSFQQIEALGLNLQQTNLQYSLAFEIHVQTGCRLRELAQLAKRDLLGLVDSQKAGLLVIRGKGGRLRELRISADAYFRLIAHLNKAEILCSYNGYRQALRRAAESLGFDVVSTHAVRRFSAQKLMGERVDEYLRLGFSIGQANEKAVGDVNDLLGHSRERMSTTKIYLNARAS